MNQLDVIISLSYYLYDKFKDRDGKTNLSITYSRMREEKRPFFYIGNLNDMAVQQGASGFMKYQNWTIYYCGNSNADVRLTSDEIIQDFNTDRKLQGYMYNYIFPQPIVTQKETDDGALSSGTIYLAVTGIKYANDGARESLPCKTLEIPLNSDNNTLVILLPKIPNMRTNFDGYNIYAGSDENSLTLQNSDILLHTGSRYDAKTTELLELTTTGSNPPTSRDINNVRKLHLVPFTQLYISSTNAKYIEDPVQDDLWDAQLDVGIKYNALLANRSVPFIETITNEINFI